MFPTASYAIGARLTLFSFPRTRRWALVHRGRAAWAPRAAGAPGAAGRELGTRHQAPGMREMKCHSRGALKTTGTVEPQGQTGWAPGAGHDRSKDSEPWGTVGTRALGEQAWCTRVTGSRLQHRAPCAEKKFQSRKAPGAPGTPDTGATRGTRRTGGTRDTKHTGRASHTQKVKLQNLWSVL